MTVFYPSPHTGWTFSVAAAASLVGLALTSVALPCLAEAGSPSPAPVDAAAAELYIQGVKIHTQVRGQPALESGVLVVSKGRLTCVSPVGPGQCPQPSGARLFDFAGKGVVIPGLVEALGRLGLYEIDAEGSSHDGTAGRQTNNAAVRALDGVTMASRAIQAARRAGVMAAVVRPQGNALIAGQSVAFRTVGATIEQALIAPSAAVHVHLGQEAKRDEPLVGSRSGQIAALRAILTRAQRLAAWPATKKLPPGPEGDRLAQLREDPGLLALVPVLLRQQPLVVHAHRADDIAAALRVQKEFALKMVIADGAEAHVVADQLAKQAVPVLLQIRVRPYDFATQRAREDAAAVLTAAGVTVALGSGESHNARNLRWEAGYAVAQGLAWQSALDGVTRLPAELLGLPQGTGTLAVGQTAALAVYDGDPLSLQSHVLLVVLGDSVEFAPTQR